MDKIINYGNLRSFAYSNDKLIKGRIKGVVIDFFGLGCQHMMNDKDTNEGIFFAESNIIYLIPYANPWGWMNKAEIALSDEIIDVIFEKYALGEDTKIASIGGSMGGLCAITYSYYAKRTPYLCVANCPVCDLPYHFTERVDLPRTLYSAFYDEDGGLEDVLKRYSPLHLAEKLPNIKYAVYHCTKDSSVNIDKHSEGFVRAMSGKNLTYVRVQDRDHCDLGPEKQNYLDLIKNTLLVE